MPPIMLERLPREEESWIIEGITHIPLSQYRNDDAPVHTGRGYTMAQCTHLDQIQDVTPRTPEGCEECLAIGDTWIHLRLCMICGHVGCCDDSKNKHATKHFHATGHPIIKSFEPREDWGWCYIDEVVLDGSQWPINGPKAHTGW
jgi:uncharacterized UBP type Zn finger protein